MQSQSPLTAKDFLARLQENDLFSLDNHNFNQLSVKNRNQNQKTSSLLNSVPSFTSVYRAYLTERDTKGQKIGNDLHVSEAHSAQTRLQIETNEVNPALPAAMQFKSKFPKSKPKLLTTSPSSLATQLTSSSVPQNPALTKPIQSASPPSSSIHFFPITQLTFLITHLCNFSQQLLLSYLRTYHRRRPVNQSCAPFTFCPF